MAAIDDLLRVMERLRAPDGCPWDREQTHETLKTQLLEECYEVLEAIEDRDTKGLQEELGDVLLQVVFHAQLAKERGSFDFDKVAQGIADKLIRRHPHVFGDQKLETSEQVLETWQQLKQKEKPERTSVLDGVPKTLPALMHAQEIQKKAARVGFDWKESREVMEKVREEVHELEEVLDDQEKFEDEVGDLLFVAVNLARHGKIDAEEACRKATQKFIERFKTVEKLRENNGKPWEAFTPTELEALWQEAKRNGT